MIGIFDSGLGGLTILKSILKTLPNYDYLYLGDNARAPYGNKHQDVIYDYTKQAVDFLFAKGCKIIIIACNTASSEALRKIQQKHLSKAYPDRRVLGVIKPLVEKIAQDDKIRLVGVIGTKATISSNIYPTELKNLTPKIKVEQVTAPLLVPLIEEGWTTEPETKSILKKYLRPLKEKNVQILIPACTHYPFLFSDMKRFMPKKCEVLNTGEIVAASLLDYLRRHAELGVKSSRRPKIEFYTTDDIEKFKILGEKFLGEKIKKIKKISLQ